MIWSMPCMLFIESSAEVGGYQADHDEDEPVTEREASRWDEDAATSSGVFLAANIDGVGR